MAKEKRVGPHGEGRWDDDLGDTKYIMNYYITKKSDPRYCEIDYEDIIVGKDRYGKTPMTIYYLYDEKQNCTDMVIDLRDVYERIPEFDQFDSYDDFLDALIEKSDDYDSVPYYGKEIIRDELVEEEDETDMLWIDMKNYPYNPEGNKLAHFADALADIVSDLNDLAGKNYDKRTLKSIIKDVEHLNANKTLYIVIVLAILGIAGIVAGIIIGKPWIWIVGIVVTVIFLGWFGLGMMGLAFETNDFRKQDFKEAKCAEPEGSRLDR